MLADGATSVVVSSDGKPLGSLSLARITRLLAAET
jgi:hypothetical protein